MAADTGVADERTSLSWQRTALAVMAGGAIMCRLMVDNWGIWSVVPLVAGLGLGGWSFAEARLRHPRQRSRGGRAALLVALAVAVLGLCEAIALVTGT
ncbi:DUF202 domain-containing protein [Gordonia mangrovi]|nr:DUF202 domain-containing protein [Gordonia mangrovi]UVF79362.1 DUF202 domain-containing protein [Gordonia mangrovi]